MVNIPFNPGFSEIFPMISRNYVFFDKILRTKRMQNTASGFQKHFI
jgi:hypothetical protein